MGMMETDVQLEQDTAEGYLIRALTENAVVVGNESFSAPFVLTAEQIIRDWHPAAPDQLTAADFDPILALEPEVIIVGTGVRQHFLPATLTSGILRQGIGIEAMSTAAACRTYNVLASEYRRVAAALFIR